MKRSTLVLLVAALGAPAGCSVKAAGLGTGHGDSGGGASGSGGVFDSGIAPGGTGGRGAGGGQGSDGATATEDVRTSDTAFYTGGATGLGGAMATGGGPGTGGGQGSGGTMGSGGATSTGGSPSLDGAMNVTDVQIGDAEPDAAMDLGPDFSGDVGDAPSRDVLVASGEAGDASDTAEAVDSGPPLTLVWFDEFEGAANTGVDTTKWSYVTWAPGYVNNEKQKYSSSLNNVFHDGNGHLVLRGRYSAGATNPYTSGRIESNGKASFGPGHRIEVKAKLPAGIGSFPAIVMMGTTGTWPQCGELALMEQYGQDKSWFYSQVSAGNAAGSGSTDSIQYTFPNATTASADFRLYSLDWYSDRVVFKVDGNLIMTSNYDPSSPLYSVPEYIILDVAIGGSMGGTVDNNGFPMDMVVDYVRVYSF
jgi:beta-glucanase (GH16 family)